MTALIINNVQMLRAIAAYCVVFYHAQAFINNFHPGAFTSHLGGIGVDIFFVISGFIMIHTNQDAARSPSQFWRDRVIRIVPLYWMATLLIAGVALTGLRPSGLHHWDAADLLTSLLFIPHVRSDGVQSPILSLGWTLIYEMFFYAVFGLTLMLGQLSRRVLAIAALFLGLWLAGRILEPAGFVAGYYFNPIMLEFAAGCGLGLLYLRTGSVNSRAARTAGTALAVLGVVTGVLGEAVYRDAMFEPAERRVALFGIPAVLIVAGALALERAGYRCTNRFLLLQGAASYAVYLIHPLVLHVTFKALAAMLPTGSGAVSVAIALAALLAVVLAGTWVHLAVEKPLGRALRRANWPEGWRRRPASRIIAN